MNNTKIYKSKYDYQKYERSDVHTTIRADLYEELQLLSVKVKEPQTKIMDCILELILKDEKMLNELKNKVRLY